MASRPGGPHGIPSVSLPADVGHSGHPRHRGGHSGPARSDRLPCRWSDSAGRQWSQKGGQRPRRSCPSRWRWKSGPPASAPLDPGPLDPGPLDRARQNSHPRLHWHGCRTVGGSVCTGPGSRLRCRVRLHPQCRPPQPDRRPDAGRPPGPGCHPEPEGGSPKPGAKGPTGGAGRAEDGAPGHPHRSARVPQDPEDPDRGLRPFRAAGPLHGGVGPDGLGPFRLSSNLPI